MQEKTKVSERRACQLVGLSRTVLHYVSSERTDNEVLQQRIIELAQTCRRFGYRRIGALLRRKGCKASLKRVFMLYQNTGLAVKRQGIVVEREQLTRASMPNEA